MVDLRQRLGRIVGSSWAEEPRTPACELRSELRGGVYQLRGHGCRGHQRREEAQRSKWEQAASSCSNRGHRVVRRAADNDTFLRWCQNRVSSFGGNEVQATIVIQSLGT